MAKVKANYSFSDLEDDRFVNPYSFVRVDFNKKSEPKDGERITGWLDYSIIAKTPLVIPDTESLKEEDNGHKVYKKFMQTPKGDLMIPGSSVRGVIRNVYETVTDSCFSTAKGRQLITARQMSAKGAGIIEIKDGVYELYDAEYYMLKVEHGSDRSGLNPEVWDDKKCPIYTIQPDSNGERYIKVPNGKKIYSGSEVEFHRLTDESGNQIEYKKKNNGQEISCGKVARKVSDKESEEGILVLGENIRNKHHARIFTKGSIKECSPDIVKRAFENLRETLNTYRDSAINKEYKGNHTGYSSFERMEKNGIVPVYYKESGGRLYLQLAAIGRVAFDASLSDLLMKKAPCSKRSECCKACSLFGMIGDDGESKGSRVRFTDAISIHKTKTSQMTLAELGSPRPAYMPFYSKMKHGDNPNAIEYGAAGTGIRGRKFYWHHLPVEEALDAQKNARNATVQAVGEKAEFSGKVYFDGITVIELKELMWSLNFWENEKCGDLCHKIGHGKPLGLGSCKIVIDKIHVRTFDKTGYNIKDVPFSDFQDKAPFPNPSDTEEGAGDNHNLTIADLLKICNFKALDGKKVCYPYVIPSNGKGAKITAEVARRIFHLKQDDNRIASHQWFTRNKNSWNKKEAGLQLLPDINASDITLKPLVAELYYEDGNKGNKGKGKNKNHQNGNKRKKG